MVKANDLITDDYWLQTNDLPHYTCEHTYEELEALKDRLMKGMAENEGTIMAMLEYHARRLYYRHDILRKLRRFRRIFK